MPVRYYIEMDYSFNPEVCLFMILRLRFFFIIPSGGHYDFVNIRLNAPMLQS